jgi:hypothetical protein
MIELGARVVLFIMRLTSKFAFKPYALIPQFERNRLQTIVFRPIALNLSKEKL